MSKDDLKSSILPKMLHKSNNINKNPIIFCFNSTTGKNNIFLLLCESCLLHNEREVLLLESFGFANVLKLKKRIGLNFYPSGLLQEDCVLYTRVIRLYRFKKKKKDIISMEMFFISINGKRKRISKSIFVSLSFIIKIVPYKVSLTYFMKVVGIYMLNMKYWSLQASGNRQQISERAFFGLLLRNNTPFYTCKKGQLLLSSYNKPWEYENVYETSEFISKLNKFESTYGGARLVYIGFCINAPRYWCITKHNVKRQINETLFNYFKMTYPEISFENAQAFKKKLGSD